MSELKCGDKLIGTKGRFKGKSSVKTKIDFIDRLMNQGRQGGCFHKKKICLPAR